MVFQILLYLFYIYSYFNRESRSQQLPTLSTDPCHPIDMHLSNGVHLMEIYQVIKCRNYRLSLTVLTVSDEIVED